MGQIEPPELEEATVFANGKIITLDESSRIFEALVTEDGKFTSVGSLSDIYRSAGPGPRVVDAALQRSRRN